MRLLELRKQNHKTQQELAKMLGMAHTSYLSYEKGVNEPNIKNLIKLADFYNVSLDYLVGREWHNDIGYLTPTQIECVNLIKKLNDKQISTAIGILTTLIVVQ